MRLYYITAFPPAFPLASDQRLDTLRLSLDGALCVVNFDGGNEPPELTGSGTLTPIGSPSYIAFP